MIRSLKAYVPIEVIHKFSFRLNNLLIKGHIVFVLRAQLICLHLFNEYEAVVYLVEFAGKEEAGHQNLVAWLHSFIVFPEIVTIEEFYCYMDGSVSLFKLCAHCKNPLHKFFSFFEVCLVLTCNGGVSGFVFKHGLKHKCWRYVTCLKLKFSWFDWVLN